MSSSRIAVGLATGSLKTAFGVTGAGSAAVAWEAPRSEAVTASAEAAARRLIALMCI